MTTAQTSLGCSSMAETKCAGKRTCTNETIHTATSLLPNLGCRSFKVRSEIAQVLKLVWPIVSGTLANCLGNVVVVSAT